MFVPRPETLSRLRQNEDSRKFIKEFKVGFTLLVGGEFEVEGWKELGLNSPTCVGLNVEEGQGVVMGTLYLGEIKKLVFTYMNTVLPAKEILPMHCSATVYNRQVLDVKVDEEEGDGGRSEKETEKEEVVVLYFGLSGTGKTTLSADSKQKLIGDDEHYWDSTGIHNIENGCYAKVINLSAQNEPYLYHAIRQNTILENVILDPKTNDPDYSDALYTENTRASYPLSHIHSRIESGSGGHPKYVVFLTCDAFGVLPPVSSLTIEQAKYHFVAGYTSKVGGTERGVNSITPTFSPMYGGAFMPKKPEIYMNLLQNRLETY